MKTGWSFIGRLITLGDLQPQKKSTEINQ